jgi:hypothetical protein
MQTKEFDLYQEGSWITPKRKMEEMKIEMEQEISKSRILKETN